MTGDDREKIMITGVMQCLLLLLFAPVQVLAGQSDKNAWRTPRVVGNGEQATRLENAHIIYSFPPGAYDPSVVIEH